MQKLQLKWIFFFKEHLANELLKSYVYIFVIDMLITSWE